MAGGVKQVGESTSAGDQALKQAIIAALGRAVTGQAVISSATLAGSFATGSGLDGISDIDVIVICAQLNADVFASVQEGFRNELAPVLAALGYRLLINATLGPLKFDDERTAVLHLMLYSAEGHREHVIKSPFTCLDWQRSTAVWQRPMAEVYPVFVLQPHHFFGARRSARDYLADLHAGMISYRELKFDGGYHEVKCGKPMTVRDRHEFAYHIMRFLMQNLLKLVRRDNRPDDGEALLEAYFAVFVDDSERFAPLYRRLKNMKKAREFSVPIDDLDAHIVAFASAFERQYRKAFEQDAVRHIFLRHAPTALNGGHGDAVRFQGRTDEPIIHTPDATGVAEARARVQALGSTKAFVSSLMRTRQTLAALSIDDPQLDPRLDEIDYGRCEGLTLAEVRMNYPQLPAAWARGEDLAFPEGEHSGAVAARVQAFLDDTLANSPSAVICTHNVVLRELIGELIGLPAPQRHRLRIPHLLPIEVVKSERFGWHLDVSETTERALFAGFFRSAAAGVAVHA